MIEGELSVDFEKSLSMKDNIEKDGSLSPSPLIYSTNKQPITSSQHSGDRTTLLSPNMTQSSNISSYGNFPFNSSSAMDNITNESPDNLITASNYESLSMPIPKRVVDSTVLDSLFQASSADQLNDLSSSSQFINNYFSDDHLELKGSNDLRISDHFSTSRPSSRLTGVIGSDPITNINQNQSIHFPTPEKPGVLQNVGSDSNLFNFDSNYLRNDSLFSDLLDNSKNLRQQSLNSTSFYHDNSTGLVRPASTPVLSTNSFHGMHFGLVDQSAQRFSNDTFSNMFNPLSSSSLLNNGSLMSSHSDSLSLSEHGAIHRPMSADIQLNHMNNHGNNILLQGSLSDYNLSARGHESEKIYNRNYFPRGHPLPNSSYHGPPGVGPGMHPSHNPRQVPHPIHRSNVNIQTINNSRHSAAPTFNSAKQHSHGSLHHHPNNAGNHLNNDLDAVSVEKLITTTCKNILKDASCRALKAVELANTLRARVGTDVLAYVRESWGGLLSLLEKHPKVFRVDRIPKNDMVTLCDDGLGKSDGASDGNGVYGDSSLNSSIMSSIGLDDDLGLRSTHTSATNLDSMGTLDGLSGNDNMNSYVSKCLHVGNVPANLSEKDLLKEFEKYGSVEAVKLINQRGRRFAFVCYRTIEMAIGAKSALSRLHPWKSAISFAHRDFVGNSLGGNSLSDGEWVVPSMGKSVSNNSFRQTQVTPIPSTNISGGIWSDPNVTNPSPRSMNSSPYPTNSRTLTPPPPIGAPARSYSQQFPVRSNMSSPPPLQQVSTDMTYAAHESFNAKNNAIAFRRVQSYAAGDTQANNFPQQQYHGYPIDYDHNHGDTSHGLNQSNGYGYEWSQAPMQETGYTMMAPMMMTQVQFNVNILRRLCDDTYVPTQTWPIDVANDTPFCEAIIAQLLQFGGATSISKLRGFLRTRINAPDNIKSVPLKALLAAYPQYFHVRNNQVTLLDFAKGSINPDMSLMHQNNPGFPYMVQSNDPSYSITDQVTNFREDGSLSRGMPSLDASLSSNHSVNLNNFSNDYFHESLSPDASPVSYRPVHQTNHPGNYFQNDMSLNVNDVNQSLYQQQQQQQQQPLQQPLQQSYSQDFSNNVSNTNAGLYQPFPWEQQDQDCN